MLRERNLPLDGLRGISILLIVVGHLGLGHIVPGGFGVTIFFALSGYLITSILLGDMAAERFSLANFYRKRVARLLPSFAVVYGIMLLVTCIWFPASNYSWQGVLMQIFYLANYASVYAIPCAVVGAGIVWTLAIEEQFYILFPMVLKRVHHVDARRMVAWMVALCLVALGMRIFYRIVCDKPPIYTYNLTECRFDAILWGCALAVIHARIPEWWRQIARPRAFLFGVGLILVSLMIRDPNFRETLRYSMQSFGILFVIAFCVDETWFTGGWRLLRAVLSWPPLVYVGVISYTLYLVHMFFFKVFPPLPWHIGPVLVFCVSFGYSVASYHLLEAPVQRLIRK